MRIKWGWRSWQRWRGLSGLDDKEERWRELPVNSCRAAGRTFHPVTTVQQLERRQYLISYIKISYILYLTTGRGNILYLIQQLESPPIPTNFKTCVTSILSENKICWSFLEVVFSVSCGPDKKDDESLPHLGRDSFSCCLPIQNIHPPTNLLQHHHQYHHCDLPPSYSQLILMSNPFIAHLIDLGEFNPRIGRHPIGGDLPQKNTFEGREEDVECVLSFTFEKRKRM